MSRLKLLLIYCFCSIQPVFADETITSNIKYALKRSTDGSYFSVIIALGVVIILIYLTGIIYAKLNVFGQNTMKKQYLDLSDSKLIVLSTTPVGNNKSLLVVELAGKKMLIGVTNENITLIKDLDEKKIQSSENTIQRNISGQLPLDKIYPMNNDFNEDEDEIKNDKPQEPLEETKYDTEEFGLYKKYLE